MAQQYVKNFKNKLSELDNYFRYLKMNDYSYLFDGELVNVTVLNVDYSTFQQINTEASQLCQDVENVMAKYTDNIGLLFSPVGEMFGQPLNLTSDEIKAEWKRRVSVIVDSIRSGVISNAGYSDGEALGWPDKVRTAERVLTSEASDGELADVQTEADARQLGETVEVLAQKQVDNAAGFRSKRNLIDGTCRRIQTQIDSLSSGQLKMIFDSINELTKSLDSM